MPNAQDGVECARVALDGPATPAGDTAKEAPEVEACLEVERVLPDGLLPQTSTRCEALRLFKSRAKSCFKSVTAAD